jgi:hypothetical protein
MTKQIKFPYTNPKVVNTANERRLAAEHLKLSKF